MYQSVPGSHWRPRESSTTRRSSGADWVLQYLVYAGLADRSMLYDRRTTVSDLSRSHAVWSIRFPDNRILIVKQARPRPGEPHGNLGSELAVYALASRDPAWRDLVPGCLLIDAQLQLLVLEGVDSESHPPSAANGAHPMFERSQELARTIAGVHRATAAKELDGLMAVEPWILGVFEPGRWRPAVLDRIVVHGTVRRELARECARLRETLEPSCLVHGDLKWDNCLFDGLRVRVIDWETAAIGDPAWDIAGILQEYETYHLIQPGAVQAPEVDQRALIRTYLEHMAPGDRAGFCRRAAALSGARMIQAALELALVTLDEQTPREMVRRGLELMRDPTTSLWGAAHA
jgi:hypothetical protein